MGAAKEGASVLLVERYGFLGGMATAGLVNPFMPYTLKRRRLTSAVFNELLDRLDDAGALSAGGDGGQVGRDQPGRDGFCRLDRRRRPGGAGGRARGSCRARCVEPGSRLRYWASRKDRRSVRALGLGE